MMNVLQTHREEVRRLQYHAKACRDRALQEFPKLREVGDSSSSDVFESCAPSHSARCDEASAKMDSVSQHRARQQADRAMLQAQKRRVQQNLVSTGMGMAACLSVGAAAPIMLLAGTSFASLVFVSLVGTVLLAYRFVMHFKSFRATSAGLLAVDGEAFALAKSASCLKVAGAFEKEVRARYKRTGKILERARDRQLAEPLKRRITANEATADFTVAPSTYGSKVFELGHDRRSVGVAWARGRREEMQDAYSVWEFSQGAIVGVFDGHGRHSQIIARLAAECVSETLIERLEALPSLNDVEAVRAALKDAFHPRHGQIPTPQSIYTKTLRGAEYSGTTALVAILMRQGTYIVNLGDCRALAIDGTSATRLTIDHTTRDSREVAKLAKRGIELEGPEQETPRLDQLAVTRGLGDTKSRIMRRPDVTYVPSHKTLFLASDGVFDVLDDPVIARYVDESSAQPIEDIAAGVVHTAYARESLDNLTAIVISAPRDELSDTSSEC